MRWKKPGFFGGRCTGGGVGVGAGVATTGAAVGGRTVAGGPSRQPATEARAAARPEMASLAPALVSEHLGGLWIYLTAPVLGAGLAVFACRCVREPGCCCAAG